MLILREYVLANCRAGAKAMIILMPILGLSWVFGILAVNEATIVFQYLFCIFNSLQVIFKKFTTFKYIAGFLQKLYSFSSSEFRSEI